MLVRMQLLEQANRYKRCSGLCSCNRNPARVVGWVSEAGKKLVFDSDGYAFCEKSKKRYKINNEIVTKINLLIKATGLDLKNILQLVSQFNFGNTSIYHS